MNEFHENVSEAIDREEISTEKPSFFDRHAMHPLLYAFLSLVIIFLIYQIGGGVLMLLVTGTAAITSENVLTVRWLTLIGQILFLLLPTLLFARLFSSRLNKVFQFRIPGLQESIFVLIALFSLQRVFEAYIYFQEMIPVPDSLHNLLQPLKNLFQELMKILVHADSPIELSVVILVVAVVPAVVEELLFRGLIQKMFERIMSPVVSAILAGTIFGLFHMNPFDLVPLIGLGVFFGMLSYRSQSLWLPISAHFLNNLMAVFASYYGLNDENLLSAVQTTDTSAMLFELVVFAGLFFASFAGYLRITQDISKQIH
jgi:uncharacterized protein